MNLVLHLHFDETRKQRLPIKHVAGNPQFMRHLVLIDQERRSEVKKSIQLNAYTQLGTQAAYRNFILPKYQVEYIENMLRMPKLVCGMK